MKSIFTILIVVAGCFGYFFYGINKNYESFYVGPTKSIPVFSYSADAGSEIPVAAILLHGFKCNKSQMIPMAKYLAKKGIRSYVVDLPGHGLASTDWQGVTHSVIPINQAIKEIKERDLTIEQKIVLVGWSTGAEIAKQIVEINKDVHHSILIGTALENTNFVKSTNNLLILNEPHDGNPQALYENRA